MNEFVKFHAKNNFLTLERMKLLEKLSQLSDERLAERYNDAFLELYRYARLYSPFYTKLYADHGVGINDIKDISDITKLPVINREMIRDHVEDIYNSLDKLKVIGLTSGTSGTPLTLYRTLFDISIEQGYIRHYRQQHGYTIGQPLLSIRGTLGKKTSFDYFKKANILYISSPDINEGTIDKYYEMVKDFKPVAVEAYPSYLHKFCIELSKKGHVLTIPNAFTSSETLVDFQREMIEPYLNTTIHDWYGNAERTILLAQDKQMSYKPLPLYSINEYREDHVITTGLISKRFPLIRYEVGDVIDMQHKGFVPDLVNPSIKGIQGRIGDNLDLRDGSVVGCIDHAFKGMEHLDMAQVHQYNTIDPIEIKIVARPAFGPKQENQLRANFVRMVGAETPLKFVYCNKEDLTYSNNDKFRLVIKNKPAGS